uniref:LRAT domain-containing protein n=1 Tax=Canis lupus dingo TaxID=286419 RepID=A0A8C0KM31_CANLU
MVQANPRPSRGDLIETFPTGFQSLVVYVRYGYVVHVAPLGKDRFCKAVVKKELLYDVVGRDKYQINNKHDDKYSPLPPSKIVQRAEEPVGQELPYSLPCENREHFVNELRYGVARSDRVRPQPVSSAPRTSLSLNRLVGLPLSRRNGRGW